MPSPPALLGELALLLAELVLLGKLVLLLAELVLLGELAPLELAAPGRRVALEPAPLARPPPLAPPVPRLDPLERPAEAFRAEPLLLLVPAFERALVRSSFRPPLRDAMMCSPFTPIRVTRVDDSFITTLSRQTKCQEKLTIVCGSGGAYIVRTVGRPAARPFDQPMRKNLPTTTTLVCASNAAPGGTFARKQSMH